MRRHIVRKHNIGGFKCEMCDKKYYRKRDLSVHIQNNHFPKAQLHLVECAVCGKNLEKRYFRDHFIRKHF